MENTKRSKGERQGGKRRKENWDADRKIVDIERVPEKKEKEWGGV